MYARGVRRLDSLSVLSPCYSFPLSYVRVGPKSSSSSCVLDVPSVTIATSGREYSYPNAFHCPKKELRMRRVVAVLPLWKSWRLTKDTGEPQIAAWISWSATMAMPARVD